MTQYIEEIEVRYDGRESEAHVINAIQLSESLAGFSRILSTAYHFAATEKLVLRSPAQQYSVYVRTAEPKCYNVVFELWELAKQQQIFQGLVGNIAVAVVTYVVASAANRKDEMKYLAEALKLALDQNGKRDEAVVTKLLATIDRMADALRPAVRQAVRPVGESCATIRVGGANGIVIDEQDKERINAPSPIDITMERTWTGVISELDRENATGKIRLEDDADARVPITVTDPVFCQPENAYLAAFVSGTTIKLVGKAEISEGEVRRIYVSNTA